MKKIKCSELPFKRRKHPHFERFYFKILLVTVFFSNLLYKILDHLHSLFPITFCFSMQPLQINNCILTKTAQKLENSQDRKQAIYVIFFFFFFTDQCN